MLTVNFEIEVMHGLRISTLYLIILLVNKQVRCAPLFLSTSPCYASVNSIIRNN